MKNPTAWYHEANDCHLIIKDLKQEPKNLTRRNTLAVDHKIQAEAQRWLG